METLRKLWGQDQDLNPELIATFLFHLNIIVQMHDEECGEELFFMPSALVCAPNDYFIDAKVSVTPHWFASMEVLSEGTLALSQPYLPKESEGQNDPVDLRMVSCRLL